jgi:hypothetical protein
MQATAATSTDIIREGLVSDYAWLRKATLTNLSMGNGNSIPITYLNSIPQHEVTENTDFMLRVDYNHHGTRLLKFRSHSPKGWDCVAVAAKHRVTVQAGTGNRNSYWKT